MDGSVEDWGSIAKESRNEGIELGDWGSIGFGIASDSDSESDSDPDGKTRRLPGGEVGRSVWEEELP